VRDERVDDLIRKTLSASVDGMKEGCADANLMAAYLEFSLSEEETRKFESHVADCARCQEILALSMKLSADAGETAQPVAEGSGKTLFHFSIPIPALGAVLMAIVLAAVVFFWNRESGVTRQTTQVAEVRSAAEKSDITPAGAPTQNAEGEVSRALAQRDTPAMEARLPGIQKKKREAILTDTNAQISLPAAPPAQAVSPVAEPLETGTERAQIAASFAADPKPQASHPAAPPEPVLMAEGKAREMPEVTPAINAPAPAIKAESAARREEVFRESVAGSGGQKPVASDAAGMIVLNAAPPRDALLGPKDGGVFELTKGASKKIKDKVFYRNAMGFWVDRQCIEHRDSPIIEILPVAAEHESIMKEYPELRDLLPALVYWNGKNYLLR